MKRFFKFIVTFIMVLLIYFAIMFHLDYFIVTDNGKVEKCQNPYYKYKDNENIFYKLSTFYEEEEEISDSQIEVIEHSKMIKNIIMDIEVVKEEQIDGYLQKLREGNNIAVIKDNIILITTGNYGLAFSMDMNNIAYEIIREFSNNRYWEARKITTDNKNEIYQKIEQELERLGITEKIEFEPETIYIKYYNEMIADWDGEIYVVEDTKHQIKIEMEVPSYKIVNMQIGFENFSAREMEENAAMAIIR